MKHIRMSAIVITKKPTFSSIPLQLPPVGDSPLYRQNVDTPGGAAGFNLYREKHNGWYMAAINIVPLSPKCSASLCQGLAHEYLPTVCISPMQTFQEGHFLRRCSKTGWSGSTRVQGGASETGQWRVYSE